jgi:hypothetical protein
MKKLLVFLVLSEIAFLSACVATNSIFEPDAQYIVALSAPTLEDKVVKAVESMNLQVQQRRGGFIETSPEKFIGREVGNLIWKKRLQEQTSYTVILIPTDHRNEFNINVYAHTEERVNDSYDWQTVKSDDDRKRANKILQRIIEIIRGNNVG